MLSQRDDPIIALATPPGRGAIGVIRLSGKNLNDYLIQLLKQKLIPRTAQLVIIKDDLGLQIDQVLAIYFPAPHSYTGEDILELQGHGGSVVLQMLLKHCLHVAQKNYQNNQVCLPYLRIAHPGEFTERAYLNQKMDLIQSEAVADLIDANTEAAARSAGRSLEGEFSKSVFQINDKIIHLRMQIEACLDFPEEDIDFIEQLQIKAQLISIQEKISNLLVKAEQGRLLRDGIKLVIAGQPNVGKSSLLNALSGADVAIVTSIAGTTRDVLSQSVQIEGVPIYLMDTAGLRSKQEADEVEKIGILRAWEQIGKADMIVVMNDLSRSHELNYSLAQNDLLAAIQTEKNKQTPLIIVNNKLDAVNVELASTMVELNISAKTGEGLLQLKELILEKAGWVSGSNEGVVIARTRHINALQLVNKHLTEALDCISRQIIPLDLLVAEECRLAQNELSKLTGIFTSDDLLGEIFSRFCIGK